MRLVKPLKEYNPMWLGIVSTLVIAGLVLGATAVGSLGLGDKRYEAEFAHTGGLRPGDDVRVAGMSVGEVTGTRLEGGKVVVSLRTNRDVELGAASRASIKLATLLGGRYVNLMPLGEGELEGSRIGLGNTEVPFDLQKVIEEGGSAVQALDGKKLRESLRVMTDTFRDTPESFGRTLHGLSRLSEVITKREGQIGRLLEGADAVAGMVNNNRTRLFALMSQSDAVLQQIVRQRDLIRDLLGDAKELLGQLEAMLAENRPQIEPLLQNLAGFTDILNRNQRALDRGIELLGPTSRYVANAFGNGPYGDMYLPYAIFPDNALCRTGVVRGCK